MWYSFAQTKVRQVSFATNLWIRNSITVMAVVMEEVLIADMQHWRVALRMSFNHTVGSRYLLNRKYLLSPVLSTDRLNTLGWILSLTLTVQLRFCVIGCVHVLFLSLAVRPWFLLPAQNQDLWLNRAENNKFDKYPHINFVPFILETTGRPGPHARKFISYPHARCRQHASCHQGHLVHHSKCPPQCHLQTTTHGRRYVTHSDYCHTQFAFYAPRSWMQVPPYRERTQRFQSQANRSRAMWPCYDFTSSDGDEHNTDNNFLLLFADVGITPTLLEGLTEVDVLHIALGCRFALDIFTISQRLSPTLDHEPLPHDPEFATF